MPDDPRPPLSGRNKRLEHIAFMLVERFSMIAFAAACEPLRLANRAAGRPLYRFSLYSAAGAACVASNEVEVSTQGAYSQASDFDGLVVCGGIDIHLSDHRQLSAVLRRAAARGATIGAVCTGAYVLAEAGLLNGYRATAHWENMPGLLTTYPKVNFGSDLFEIDRRRMTCAGGTAAADMMLAIIMREHGPGLASTVADQLIHHRIRESNERQRMDPGMRLGVSNAKLLRAVALMAEHLDVPMSAVMLAEAVHVSPRQLERLFIRYLGRPPARHYLQMRLERARDLLRQTTLPLLEVAAECGFNSSSHFSKAYGERFGHPPSAERRMAFRVCPRTNPNVGSSGRRRTVSADAVEDP